VDCYRRGADLVQVPQLKAVFSGSLVRRRNDDVVVF
jgi:hypothetical protein